MKLILVALFLVVGTNAAAQAVMNNSGSWATATNWVGSNIGDLVTETVTINGNVNPTVVNGSTFTVGNTTLNNNNTLTINTGGTLNIGNSSNASSLTTNNNAGITVNGTLIIWGSLIVNNNIVWNIQGTVIIHGNVQLNNNANLNVTGGTLQVGGNFTASNNTNISVPSGSITIAGSVNVGNGSNLSGCAGCFQRGGSCTGPSGFCTNTVLPITLVNFQGNTNGSEVSLTWSTLTEINFDEFIIERSPNGKIFSRVGEVAGHGNSNSMIDYHFVDPTPVNEHNYYRLKAVDYNGSSEYSNIIRVSVTPVKTVAVFPDPVDDIININVNFEPDPDDLLIIYNSVGVAVVVTTGRNPGGLRVDNTLTAGIYSLRYVNRGVVITSRFIKK